MLTFLASTHRLDQVNSIHYGIVMDGLADRIRIARKAAGLTQAALGAKIGVTKQAVTQWESGIKPSRENLLSLAKATDAPTHWLMMGGHLPEQDANGKFVVLERSGGLVPQQSVVAAIAGVKPLPGARHIQAFFPCGPYSYFIEVPDSSNEPKYSKGDIWVLDPDSPHEPGSMVLAARGDAKIPVFGRLRIETGSSGAIMIVSPLNQDWPAARSDLEPLTIVARMVESIGR